MKKSKKIIKFKRSELKGIFCLEDFYKKFIQEEIYRSLSDCRNIKANQKTLDIIYEVMKKNIYESNDKRVKALNKRGRDMAFAMDWLCFSPYTSEKVEDFCLEITW